MSATTLNLTEHLCHTQIYAKVPCLLQKPAKFLVAMQVVVHLKVVISSVIQLPWIQNKCKQFLQQPVTFSNKMEHWTLTFLEKFFFPCCDQKSDSEVNHHKIKIQAYTHTDFSLIYLIAVSSWLRYRVCKTDSYLRGRDAVLGKFQCVEGTQCLIFTVE
jgi:hypothetical protein